MAKCFCHLHLHTHYSMLDGFNRIQPLVMADGGQTELHWLGFHLPPQTPTIVVLHTIFDICTTGPWAVALMAVHSGLHGVDPLLILTVLEVVLALSIILLTSPRTLTFRRNGT